MFKLELMIFSITTTIIVVIHVTTTEEPTSTESTTSQPTTTEEWPETMTTGEWTTYIATTEGTTTEDYTTHNLTYDLIKDYSYWGHGPMRIVDNLQKRDDINAYTGVEFLYPHGWENGYLTAGQLNKIISLPEITEGNHTCIRSSFQKMRSEMFRYPHGSHQLADNFEVCLRCYLDCLGHAPPFSDANNWDELWSIFFTDPYPFSSSHGCTSICDRGTFLTGLQGEQFFSNGCKDYEDIWALYLSNNVREILKDDGYPEYNKTNIEVQSIVKKCNTQEMIDTMEPEQIKEIASNHLFTNWFDQSCLLNVFDSYFDFRNRDDNEKACKPCYEQCLRNNIIYSFSSVDQLEDMISFRGTQSDKNCDIDAEGMPCAGTCLNYEEVWNKYLLRQPYPGEDENQPVAHWYVRNCIIRELGDDKIENFGVEADQSGDENETAFNINQFLQINHSEKRNSCFRYILDKQDESPNTDLIPDSEWGPCKWCYRHCIGAKSQEMHTLEDQLSLLNWFTHGPDRYDAAEGVYTTKCSSDCDEFIDYCKNWNVLANALFMNEDNKPTDDTKECLTVSVSDALKEEIYINLGEQSYYDYFNDSPFKEIENYNDGTDRCSDYLNCGEFAVSCQDNGGNNVIIDKDSNKGYIVMANLQCSCIEGYKQSLDNRCVSINVKFDVSGWWSYYSDPMRFVTSVDKSDFIDEETGRKVGLEVVYGSNDYKIIPHDEITALQAIPIVNEDDWTDDNNGYDDNLHSHSCIRSYMSKLRGEYLKDQEKMGADSFEQCLPCYISCIGQSKPYSTIQTWNDLWSIFFEPPVENCTSACDTTDENGNTLVQCKKYEELWGLYMSQQTRYYAEDHNYSNNQMIQLELYTIKDCTTNELKNTMDQTQIQAISTNPLFSNIFKDSCLIEVFDTYFNFRNRDDNEKACKPCYDNCIRRNLVYSLKNVDELEAMFFGNPDLKCDVDSLGNTCPGTCLDYEGVWNKYLLRQPLPTEDLTAKITHFYTAQCIKKEIGEEKLRNEFAKEAKQTFKLSEMLLLGWDETRNTCFRYILEKQHLSPHSKIPQNQWAPCKWCYKDCIGRHAKDLNMLETKDDLLNWLEHGPDKYDEKSGEYTWECSNKCKKWVDYCQGWNGLSQYLFKDEETGLLTSDARHCLTTEISDKLKEEMYDLLQPEEYSKYFDVSPYYEIETYQNNDNQVIDRCAQSKCGIYSLGCVDKGGEKTRHYDDLSIELVPNIRCLCKIGFVSIHDECVIRVRGMSMAGSDYDYFYNDDHGLFRSLSFTDSDFESVLGDSQGLLGEDTFDDDEDVNENY